MSWTKDSSGQITFNCSYFDITAQSDAAHDIYVVGRNNIIRGGNKNDKITIGAEITNTYNTIYAGGGDDEISILTTASTYGYIYLQSGNNTVLNKGGYVKIVGGTGDDNISTSGANNGSTAYAIDLSLGGNNTVNLLANQRYLVMGGAGDDTFNVSAGVTNSTLIGNGGNNTLNNLGSTKIIATNITNSTGNAYTAAEAIVLNSSQTISDITLTDGKRYSIQNRQAINKVLLYTIDATGRTVFNSAESCTIRALDNTSYKVGFDYSASNMIFYGSEQNDDINAGNYNTIYCGGGDDTIVAETGSTVYLEKGNNNLTLSGAVSTIIGGTGNDTFNINSGDRNVINGGGGNNIFNINASKVHVTGGTGNDTFNLKAGITSTSIVGGGGTDTATGNIAGLKYASGLSNVPDSATGVLLGAGETKTVSINGIDYILKNKKGEKNSINIYFNPIDGKVYFSGVHVEIRGETEKQHDVVLDNGGYLTFYGGNLDDRIENNAITNTIYGTAGNNTIIDNSQQAQIISGNGDNTIIMNVSSSALTLGDGNNTITLKGSGNPTITAGNGNNTWYINANNISLVDSGGNNVFHVNGNNNNITGGTGNDTFIINGDNNITQGSAGNDYFQVNTGADNNVIGGTGTNYIVDSGTGTINNTGDVIKDPNSGVLSFNDNSSSQTITIAGKTYTVKNTSTERGDIPNNSLLYNYNALTGEIVFNGNGFTITSNDDSQHKIVVRGDHNVVSGGNKNDNITVDTGTGNVVHGMDGDDTITMKSANNKIYGDSGNDKIIINASNGNNIIDGGLGNDDITINANGCTNIQGGDGNDRINSNGNNNVMDGGLGDDYILAVGNDNTINSSSGKNTLNIKGSGNTINDTGSSANNVGIDGVGNNINLGNGNNTVNIIGQTGGATGNTVHAGNGNNSFTLKGDKADITTGDGNNKFVVDGNNSQITSGAGTDNFTVNGSNNLINAGAGEDSFYITGKANTANGGDGEDYFEIRPNADNNNIDGNGGENKMINYGKDTVFANVKDITPDPIIVRLQVGANSDDNSAIFIQTDFITDDLNVNLMTKESSVDAIANIDKILNAINAQKANYGATLSRLDSVAQSQVVQLENLISATSTIMDADIAEESAIFVKNQILQSTSSALLKQATQLQYSIISNLIK